MTLKKINKSGQSIFEYFILTAVIATAVLFFTASQHFKDIQSSCEDAFDGAVQEMLK